MYLQYTLFFIFYFLFIYQKCTDFHGTLKWVLDCIDPDHQLFYTHTNIFRSRTIFTYQKFPTTVSTSPHSQLWTHSNRSKLYMYLLANLRISSLFICCMVSVVCKCQQNVWWFGSPSVSWKKHTIWRDKTHKVACIIYK